MNFHYVHCLLSLVVGTASKSVAPATKPPIDSQPTVMPVMPPSMLQTSPSTPPAAPPGWKPTNCPPGLVKDQADGVKLHLSHKSGTGYLGVGFKRESSGKVRFKVRHRSASGKQFHIGYYDTAVEAAVAYATTSVLGKTVPGAAEVVDGYTLLRADRQSSTGYLGVTPVGKRFKASAFICKKEIYIGRYDSAVKAAVARAKLLASADGACEVAAACESCGDVQTVEQPRKKRRFHSRHDPMGDGMGGLRARGD